jgi:hypothetical protein
MIKLSLIDTLLYCSATVSYRGNSATFSRVLVDTGSGGTIFSSEVMETIGIQAELTDIIHRVRGVGGAEYVYSKQVESFSVGNLTIQNFEIEVGAMDYGFDLDGILGLDFLMRVNAIIDLGKLEISSPNLT